MKAYLLSIAGIAILTSLLSRILPTGKTHKLLCGILKLCCLTVLLGPIVTKLHSLPSFSGSVAAEDAEYLRYCESLVQAEAESEIKDKIFREFHVTVSVSAEVEGVRLKKIYFGPENPGMSGAAPHIYSIDRIIEYLQKEYRVEVEYDGVSETDP